MTYLILIFSTSVDVTKNERKRKVKSIKNGITYLLPKR